MTTLKTASRLSLFLGLTSALLAAPAISAPGNEWDIFKVGQGDPTSLSLTYVHPSIGSIAGNEFDSFKSGSGEPLNAAMPSYMGTSIGSLPGQGWDTHNVGEGEML